MQFEVSIGNQFIIMYTGLIPISVESHGIDRELRNIGRRKVAYLQ